MPFGEASVSASELGIVYFTSATVAPASGAATSEEYEFCRQIAFQTDYPGDMEYSDCTTGEIKAGKINIRNTGKKYLSVLATIKGKSLFGMIETERLSRQRFG
jgi:hypothetical protein